MCCLLESGAVEDGACADNDPDFQSALQKGTWFSSRRRRTETEPPAVAVPTSSRIAIIGAGPAGIHMASKLKKLGYANVSIYEKTDRIGGKSFTLYRDGDGNPCTQQPQADGTVDTQNCLPVEMGACFLHSEYNHVRWLLKEYGLTAALAPEGRAIYTASGGPLDTFPFFLAELIKRIDGFALVPELRAVWNLLKAMKRYNNRVHELFGTRDFEMPSRLSATALEQLDMTFAEFLERNSLGDLLPFVTIAMTAQGYGRASGIPAYYGLLWMKPTVLNGFLQSAVHSVLNGASESLVKEVAALLVGGRTGAAVDFLTMLPEGYQAIWTTMAATDGLDVRLGVDVKSIDRQLDAPDAPVKIYFAQGGQDLQEEADFLINTAPHALANSYMPDLTESEKTIFDDLSYTVLVANLYKSDPIPGYNAEGVPAPIMYDISVLGSESADGLWAVDRDDYQIFSGAPSRNGERVGGQFFADPCAADDGPDDVLCNPDRFPNSDGFATSDLAPMVEVGLNSSIESRGGANVRIEKQFPWPFFWRFSQEGIQKGYPWDLLEMQGKSKTFWVGASAVFESIHDVVHYNLQILDAHFGGNFQEELDSYYVTSTDPAR